MADNEQPTTPAGRPAPSYGEYAPEGWEWKPETPAVDSQQPAEGGQPGSAAPRATGTPGNLGTAVGGQAQPVRASGNVPGVPHNLGAPRPNGQQAPVAAPVQQPATPPAPGEPAPYRAAAPSGSPQPQPQQPVYTSGAPRKPRLVDRVFTIILLAFGALGALNTSNAFFQLEPQIQLTATMIGIDSPQLASWIGPLGTITGFVTLLLFAVTLLFSIQRMRAGKLTFWVPLVAGVIAALLLFIVPMIAMGGAPEIMQQIEADPSGSIDKMLDYLQQTGQ